MPFSCMMTGCWSRSTTRMAPKPSGLRTLWPPIAEKKVCVCEATKAPVGLLSNRTVLRKQDGGALPRQVRICPVLLNHKIQRFHVRNRWIFFIGWPYLVLTTILTTMRAILSGRSQGQVDFLHSRALYPLFSEKEKTIPLFLLSQVKKLAQYQNGISAICNSTMLLLH